MDCELCKSRDFKYTCPRCNIKYCSLDCYRSVNHRQCSEAFYKECVVNELKDQHAGTDDKKNVFNMLQRIGNDEIEEDEWEDLDSDDSEEEELAERLDGIDLNNADAVWEKLTKAEKEEFKSIVYNGEIENILELVDPWWKQNLEYNKMVVDVEENDRKLKEILQKCPAISTNIKDFSKISSKKPASCIVYNISNILGTYCYIFRFYNGDHHSYTLEATNNFISICDNLKLSHNFEDVISSIDTIILNCPNQNLFADLNTKELLLEDIRCIFNGPSSNTNEFLMSAISDVISLFEGARLKLREYKTKRKSKNDGEFSSEFPANIEDNQNYPELKNQTHLVGCIKKLEFYLSFLRDCYGALEWKAEFL